MTAPKLLVSVAEASEVIAQSEWIVRDLAKRGILEKRYVGKGTRNYRITYASLVKYVESLSIDPIPVGESA